MAKDVPFKQVLSELIYTHIDSYEDKKDIYKSMCNVKWRNKKTDETILFTWRAIGKLISEVEGNFDEYAYLNYYNTGGEGQVKDSIKKYLAKKGWKPIFPYYKSN